MRIRTPRRALTRVMAAAALTGAMVATPTASHAASSCGAGPTVTDNYNRTFKTKTCPTWTGTNVYGARSSTTPAIGYLYAGNNWVVCQDHGNENPTFGMGYRNNIWLYTQGDVIKSIPEWKAWGFIPATAVSIGLNYNPIPGVPWCSTVF